MEVSRLQAWAEVAKRKAAEATEDVVVAKTMALSEYQSLAEFKQVCGEYYNEGVRGFMYNIWLEHPEWDLSFLEEAARENVAEFNKPPEILLTILMWSLCLLPTSLCRSLTSPIRSSMKTLLRSMLAVVVELMRTTRWFRSTILLRS